MHRRISAHHLRGHQHQKVPQQRPAVEDERLAEDNGKGAQEHRVSGVAIESLDHQPPAQQDRRMIHMCACCNGTMVLRLGQQSLWECSKQLHEAQNALTKSEHIFAAT